MKRFIYLLVINLIFVQLLTSQVVNVRIGNTIYKEILNDNIKNQDEYIHIFNIKIGDDGIITNIDHAGEKDLKNPIKINILRKGNEIIIEKNESQQNIKWLNNKIEVIGPSFTNNANNSMSVIVSSSKNEIYKSSEFILRNENGCLVEQFLKKPSNYLGFRYIDNILYVDYRFKNNLQFKYTYKKSKDKILATYYYHIEGEDFSKFSPEIEIKDNSKIHSDNVVINVINYFILKASDDLLEEVLFPLIFLPNPVS